MKKFPWVWIVASVQTIAILWLFKTSHSNGDTSEVRMSLESKVAPEEDARESAILDLQHRVADLEVDMEDKRRRLGYLELCVTELQEKEEKREEKEKRKSLDEALHINR